MGTCIQVVLSSINMRVLILVLVVFLAVAVVHGQKGKGKGKGKGKPSKPEPESGSGEEGAGAGAEETSGKPSKGKGKGKPTKPSKGKGKGKGKPSKPTSCPESAQIIAMAAEKYAGEICMFTAMGWLDNDMVADDNMIEADLMTLPNKISDALTGDDFAQCVAEFEASAMGFGQKCVKTYAEEEAAVLTAVLNGVARTECFKTMMDHSCGLYMSNTMAAMAGLGNTGSGSDMIITG